MKTLRLPPFENDFPLHPQGWSCKCPTAASTPSVELMFPGGVRKRCPACRAVWLELEQLELPAWMRNIGE
jgi:hypothetical protein